MKGIKFESLNEVKQAFENEVRAKPETFFRKGFESWRHRAAKFIVKNGDYVEFSLTVLTFTCKVYCALFKFKYGTYSLFNIVVVFLKIWCLNCLIVHFLFCIIGSSLYLR